MTENVKIVYLFIKNAMIIIIDDGKVWNAMFLFFEII